jgi:hypothetical protein
LEPISSRAQIPLLFLLTTRFVRCSEGRAEVVAGKLEAERAEVAEPGLSRDERVVEAEGARLMQRMRGRCRGHEADEELDCCVQHLLRRVRIGRIILV